MSEATYSVWVDNTCYAKGMPIQIAMILVKAIFDYYWEDPTIQITVQRDKVSVYEKELD